MNWEMRAYERRRKARGRRTAAIALVIFTLLVVGVMHITAGLISGARSAKQAPAAAYSHRTASPVKDLAAAIPEASETGQITKQGQTEDWMLRLVNTDHPLPEKYQVDTRELPNGLTFDARAFDNLMRMIGDAKEDGMSLVVCSAYRSFEKQKELYENKVVRIRQEEGIPDEQAREEAAKTIALPGTSEHNLGLAVDIVALSYQQLDEGYLDTEECKWMEANSWKYGFIMRYPDGKSDITHITFEPWHYRFVGMDAAKAIHESGQCLEEYLGKAH